MAGPEGANLKGWQKTFNTVTHQGRLHVAYLSVAIWSSVFLMFKFRPKKTKEIKN